MITIVDLNNKEFSVNGVRYIKNFLAIYFNDGLKIVNAYDNRIDLIGSVHFNEVSVNGITYENAEGLSAVLSSILFSKIVNQVDLPSYQTLVLLNSEFTDPEEHNTAVVSNDGTSSNNGYYTYYSSAWVKFADTQTNINTDAIAEIVSDLGDKSDLQTTYKTTHVAAINEVKDLADDSQALAIIYSTI